jgi:hypothetical protein
MYVNFAGNSEGERYLGRPKFKRGNSMKMDSKELGCEDVDWTELTHDRA